MRIYIASRYDRREEMEIHATLLNALGHEVTSTWIKGNHEMGIDGSPVPFAEEDYYDLERSDLVLSFTEEKTVGYNRGGRHVEFGLGLGLDKLMVIIGPRENVFHHLPYVFQFDNILQFADELLEGKIKKYHSTIWEGSHYA